MADRTVIAPPNLAFDAVVLLCRAYGLPEPEREVRFHATRRWRADYLWRRERVILEIDGGIGRGRRGGGTAIGGHTTITGILRDMDKGNEAQLCGFCYLRATPRQVQQANTLALLLHRAFTRGA